MILNSKLTWGLAWAGLAVIVAVPSADFLTGKMGGDGSKAAVLTSDVEPVKTSAATSETAVKTSSVTTVKTKNGVKIVPAGSNPADPVDKLLGNGKPLPDYISDGAAPGKPAAPAKQTQIASIDPAPVVAPTPFPAWARPKFQPAAIKPAETTKPAPIAIEAPIVDETTLTGSISNPARPVPPAPIVDDTANWDTESLQRYLDRNNLLSDGGRSSARVTERSTNYDPDGFYLSDGPNGQRETRRQRILRMLEESDDDLEPLTLF